MAYNTALNIRLKEIMLTTASDNGDVIKKAKRIQDNLPTVYGYVRVSTEKQVIEGQSIDAQVHTIKEYCVRNKLPDPIIMTDEGISGKSTENRHKFNEMLTLVKRGDIIISYSMSRLGRDTFDIVKLFKDMIEKGVRLLCLDRNFDSSTMEGKFMTTVMIGLNEYEREQAAARTSMVMQSMKKQGKLRTKGPFGYRAIGNELVPIPEEQKVIEFIAQFIANNPDAKDSVVTRAVQQQIDLGELSMRKSKPRAEHEPPLKRPCDGKKAHQITISNIIKNHNLRDKMSEILVDLAKIQASSATQSDTTNDVPDQV